MIHHGVYGSRQTGMFVGTTAVIIPTFSERESNAGRIVAQGAAEIAVLFSHRIRPVSRRLARSRQERHYLSGQSG